MLRAIPRLSLQVLYFRQTRKQQARTLQHPNKQRHYSSPLKPLSLIASSALRKQLMWCHHLIMFRHHLKARASSIRLSKYLSKRRRKASKATCLLQIKQIQHLLLRICCSLKRKIQAINSTYNRANQFHH